MLLTKIYRAFFFCNVVSSKPSVGPLPRIKTPCFKLPICRDELISAPNIITFLLNPLPSDNEKLVHASNPISYPEYLCLPKSAFLVNLAGPNKEFPNAKSLPRLNSCKFTS